METWRCSFSWNRIPFQAGGCGGCFSNISSFPQSEGGAIAGIQYARALEANLFLF
jgi:hypothetical protein